MKDWVSTVGVIVTVLGVGGGLSLQSSRAEARLMAHIVGVETRLTERLDRVETRLTGRIDSLEKRLDHRIDGLDTRLRAIEIALGKLDTGLLTVEQHVAP